MKTKAETSMHIQGFTALFETQFNTKIKCLRYDNGKEFLLTDFFSFIQKVLRTKPLVWRPPNKIGK